MPKYRKKAVILDAEQFDVECATWPLGVYHRREDNEDHYYVDTNQGTVRIFHGDMVVMGIKGERYPVNYEAFMETHDIADVIQPG
jgi:hypothetical protein